MNTDIGYATVREFHELHDRYRELIVGKGDLKDFQRPWVVDQVLKSVSAGSRIVEIGGDRCQVADYLQRKGYQVWVVDLFEGFGGGGAQIDQVRAKYPKLTLVKGWFHDCEGLPAETFDAVYSVSVLEHTPPNLIPATFERIAQVLKPGGRSMHAVDYTLEGTVLRNGYLIDKVMQCLGESRRAVDIEQECLADLDTFYLSAQGHYWWRKSLNRTYDEYPFRRVTSLNVVSVKPR